MPNLIKKSWTVSTMHPFFALHHGSNVYINSYFKLFTFDLTRYFLSLFIVLIRLASQKVCSKTKIKKYNLIKIVAKQCTILWCTLHYVQHRDFFFF